MSEVVGNSNLVSSFSDSKGLITINTQRQTLLKLNISVKTSSPVSLKDFHQRARYSTLPLLSRSFHQLKKAQKQPNKQTKNC